jgi:antitoxin component YwqK of YwqJK toxin-antitoxin module
MQKRYQVTMPLWMADYFEEISTYYNQHFSDMIRLFLCSGIIKSIEVQFPEYKLSYYAEGEVKTIEDFGRADKLNKERIQEMVLFETQRAIEYRRERKPLRAEENKNA